MAAKRNAKGQFEKGSSGNPNGRPSIPAELKKYAKKAPEKLIEIVEKADTPARLKADILRWMVEMSYGKAPQQINMDGKMDVKPVVFEGEDDIPE